MNARAAVLAVVVVGTVVAAWALLRVAPSGHVAAAPVLTRAPAQAATPTGFEGAARADVLPVELPAAVPAQVAAASEGPEIRAKTLGDALPIPLLELEVVLPDAQPASGVSVVLARGEDVLAFGSTDRDGCVTLPGSDVAASLHVGGGGRSLHSELLNSPCGRHRVTLPGTAVISGVVTVNGAPPGARVVGLTLRVAEKDVWPTIPGTVTTALRGPVASWGERFDVRAQRVTGDGRFAFAGVAPGDDCVIVVAPAYMTAQRTRRVPVTAPAAGVHLDLVEAPALRGRAVWWDTRLPVARCSVQASVQTDLASDAFVPPALNPGVAVASSESFSVTFTADEEGRFRIPLDRPILSMTLDLLDPESGGRGQLAVEPFHDLAGKDLGDVPVGRARVLSIEVQDAAGMPVAGALALLDGQRRQRSPPSGADGLTELRGVPEQRVAIAVTAPGFETTRLDVEAGGDTSLQVRLATCAQLEVVVRTAAGPLPGNLCLQLDFKGLAFTGDDGTEPEAIRADFGASTATEISRFGNADDPSAAGAELRYPLPVSGHVSISGLRSGVILNLSVRDGALAEVVVPQAVVLASGEMRRLEFLVEAAAGQ